MTGLAPVTELTDSEPEADQAGARVPKARLKFAKTFRGLVLKGEYRPFLSTMWTFTENPNAKLEVQ